jgi:hypothetical protein
LHSFGKTTFHCVYRPARCHEEEIETFPRLRPPSHLTEIMSIATRGRSAFDTEPGQLLVTWIGERTSANSPPIRTCAPRTKLSEPEITDFRAVSGRSIRLNGSQRAFSPHASPNKPHRRTLHLEYQGYQASDLDAFSCATLRYTSAHEGRLGFGI